MAREPLRQTNIRLYVADVDEAKAIAESDACDFHAVLRRAVRLGLREMKKRKKGIIR